MRNGPADHSIGAILDVAFLWPLRAIERSRGWGRLGLLALYAIAAISGVGLLWRRSELSKIPDVGEPLEVAAHRSRSRPADGQNASIPYRQAVGLFRDMSELERGAFGRADLDWARADATLRVWVDEHDRAVTLLCDGSRRSEASFEVPPGLAGSFGEGERQEVIRRLSWIANVALFKAGKLQAEGDMEGSWGLINAVVRSSRHMLRALPTGWSRGTATIQVQFAHDPVARWASDPSASGPLLRRALHDLVAAESLAPPLSLGYIKGYIAADALLDDLSPLRFARGRAEAGRIGSYSPGLMGFLGGEPERGRRLLRMLIANDLRWCDRPAGFRPPYAVQRLKIFGPDPAGGETGPQLPAEALARLVESSPLAPTLAWRLDDIEGWARNDRWSLGRLEEAVAVALFAKEVGRAPASPAEALRRYLPTPGDRRDRDEAEPIATPTDD